MLKRLLNCTSRGACHVWKGLSERQDKLSLDLGLVLTLELPRGLMRAGRKLVYE